MVDRSRILFSFTFIVWTAFVLAAFYAVQKPFTPQDVSAVAEFPTAFEQSPALPGLLDALLNLVTAGLIGSAAMVIGFRLSPLTYPHVDTALIARAEFWLLSIGIGFGAISIVMLGLALLGWLNPLLVAVLALALLLLKPWRVLALFGADLLSFRQVTLPRPLAIFMTISLSLALLVALTPPHAFDAWLYHLTIPKRALDAGRLVPSGDIIPSESYPLLMAMLYLLAMLVRGDIAAQLLHFGFGLLTLTLVATAARRYYSRAAVPCALVIALSMPMLLLLATWAYTDLALTFYALAAVYSYRRWRDERADHFLLISALMAGCAMGLKYTSFVLPVGLVILMVIQERQRALRAVVQFALLSLLVAAPWYLKNFAFTGNPVYPFVFGGAHWDALRAAWYARAGSGIGFDPLALLSLPLVVTLGYRDATFVDGRLGPLILMLAPLLIRNSKQRFVSTDALDPFVVLFVIYCGFWTLGVISSTSLWQARLLLPALALIAPALGQAIINLAQLDRPTFSLRRVTNIIISLVLSLTLFTQSIEFMQINPLAYVIGAESRAHFLVRQWHDHVTAMDALNQLPANARIQFMWEPRSYLASRSARVDLLLDALPHLLATTGSLEAGVHQLKSEGFTHVLVWEAGASFAVANMRDQFSETDAENLRRLERDYLRLVYENPSYRLLEIK